MTTAQTSGAQAASNTEYVDLLLYSDDSATRQSVIEAVGRRAGKGLPLIRWTESATQAGAVSKVESTDFALLVLDGETAKVGGMALARQLKNEIYDCPPVLILTGRPQDQWLATWADADAVVPFPLDPMELQRSIAELLRAGRD